MKCAQTFLLLLFSEGFYVRTLTKQDFSFCLQNRLFHNDMSIIM